MKKFNKFHIVNKRKIFFAIPLVLFVVATLFFAFKGFNWDIDFLGGTTVHVSVGKEMTNAEMAKISGASCSGR